MTNEPDALDRRIREALDHLSLPQGLEERVRAATEIPDRSPNFWGKVSVAAAAAVFFGVLALILLPNPRPQGFPAAPGQEKKVVVRQWFLPMEVSRSKTARHPVQVFRTHSGITGIFLRTYPQVDEEPGELPFSLILSKDGEKWSRLQFEGWDISNPHVAGDIVSFVINDPVHGGGQRFVTIDAATTKEIGNVGVDGKMEMIGSQLVATEKERYVLLKGSSSLLRLSRSEDGGKTWSKPKEIHSSIKAWQETWDLLITPSGLHVFDVTNPEELTHYFSSDKGDTWRNIGGVPVIVDASLGRLKELKGFSIGKDIHWVCLTQDGHVVHYASHDEGKTWKPGKVITQVDMPMQLSLQICGSEQILAFAFTKLVREDKLSDHFHRARLFTSRNAGKEWVEETIFAGIRGDTGTPAIWIEPGGEILTSFGVYHKGTRRYFVLLRNAGDSPFPSAPLEEAGRLQWPDPDNVPEWWEGTDSRPDEKIKIEKEWKGADSKIEKEEFHRILNREDWIRLWERHAGKEAKAPDVDFEKNMAVAIFTGEYDWLEMGVESVTKTQEAMVVMCSRRVGKNGLGEPKKSYLILLIPKSWGKLILMKRDADHLEPTVAQKFEAVQK